MYVTKKALVCFSVGGSHTLRENIRQELEISCRRMVRYTVPNIIQLRPRKRCRATGSLPNRMAHIGCRGCDRCTVDVFCVKYPLRPKKQLNIECIMLETVCVLHEVRNEAEEAFEHQTYNTKYNNRMEEMRCQPLLCCHSFSSLSYDRSKASSKASCPHSTIQSFLFQMRVSSPFLKVIQ
jgi:hypothetical protein